MDVVEPRFRWILPTQRGVPVAVRRRRVAARADARGSPASWRPAACRTSTTWTRWFAEPHGRRSMTPSLLPDIDRLLDRLALARERGERVLVFGDFDADGLTGLAIMVLALRRYGLTAEPYVPSRLEEGHGLSLAALDAAERVWRHGHRHGRLRDHQPRRDRGGERPRDRRHRHGPPPRPAGVCRRPSRWSTRTGRTPRIPDRRLAGSGVAFKVAQALLADLPGGPAAALDLVDLATIGTVADVAPIVGENRAIARLGIERMRRAPTTRDRGPADTGEGRAVRGRTSRPSASRIAPRLNAAGRVGEALEAARLLLADDAETADGPRGRAGGGQPRAARPAEAIGRGGPGGGGGPARCRRSPAPPWSAGRGASASWGSSRPGWPRSTAGRRSSGRRSATSIRASCRSDGSLDLGATLERCADLFTRFGGHAGAAGFELPADRWDAFRERFLALAEERAPRDPRLPLAIDLALPALDVDYALWRELAGLAPAGPGNPEPLIAVLGMTVTRVRAANGGHSQLTLRRRPRCARRHRVRSVGPRGDGAGRGSSRCRGAAREPAVRWAGDAPARDPRRRHGRPP